MFLIISAFFDSMTVLPLGRGEKFGKKSTAGYTDYAVFPSFYLLSIKQH
jgi:hypothetical protein